MNSLLQLPGAPAWFMALLDYSLQAAFLCALVFVVTKTAGRWIPPAFRALLWFVVIARVLIPYAPPSQFSFQNLFAKPAIQSPAPLASAFIPFQEELPVAPTTPITSAAISKSHLLLGRVLSIVWSVSITTAFVFFAARCLILRFRLSRETSRPPQDILAQLKSAYPIRVSVSERITAPALTGLLPARLILPKSLDQLTPEQTRHILLHELAHIRQGHLLLHWLALIARVLHWFNPVIHFAAARLRLECELAADDAALNNATAAERAAYGQTILQILAASTTPSTQLVLAMAERAQMAHRLRAITEPRRHFRIPGAIALCALAVTGLSGADQTQSVPTNPKSVNHDKNTKEAQSNIEPSKKAGIESQRIGVLSPPVKSRAEMVQIDKSWNTFSQNNSVSISQARKKLIEKLDTVRITEFRIPVKENLVEILKRLSGEIKNQDSTGKGINLLIAPLGKAQPIDAQKFEIRLKEPLRELTIRQVLDAVLKAATPPADAPPKAKLRYSTEEYGIVIFAIDPDRPSADLYQRIFQVDPSTFSLNNRSGQFFTNPFQALTTNSNVQTSQVDPALLRVKKFGADLSATPFVPFTNPSPSPVRMSNSIGYVQIITNVSSVQHVVRELFAEAGIHFPTNQIGQVSSQGTSPQKAMFYHDRSGMLYVRAPLEELDAIEKLLNEKKSSGPSPK